MINLKETIRDFQRSDVFWRIQQKIGISFYLEMRAILDQDPRHEPNIPVQIIKVINE